jgi:serine/threonine protein kinase
MMSNVRELAIKMAGTKLKVNRHVYVLDELYEQSNFGVLYLAHLRNHSTSRRWPKLLFKIILPGVTSTDSGDREKLANESLRNCDSIAVGRDFVRVCEGKCWGFFMDKYDCDLMSIYERHYEESNSLFVFEEERVRTISYQVLNAVSYMHNLGFVHGDLKLDNILLKGEQVALADFGQTVLLKDGDLLIRNGGSRGYQAPEMLARRGHGKPADMWAFGVVLYTLATGTNPGLPMDDSDFVLTIPSTVPISPDLDDLIRRLLVWNPADRLTATEVLVHPFYTELHSRAKPVRINPPPAFPLPLSVPVVCQT